MPVPNMSDYFKNRNASCIRMAQMKFLKRKEDIDAINVSIGNVILPVHPAMYKRMKELTNDDSPFEKGLIQYTASVGLAETNEAFLKIINASGFDTSKLYSQITDGGSNAMELIIIGVCGPAGSKEKPLLLFDAIYTNYLLMANRTGRPTLSITRKLQDNGKFTLPDIKEIENLIIKEKPGAILVIPYDNPTGNFYSQETLIEIAELCVKYNLWMISDEVYRELCYIDDQKLTSIWGLTNEIVPGIEGRRIGIESASKLWNACGLRIGAIITDNFEFHQKCVFEHSANLCASAIGQYVMGGIANLTIEELKLWYEQQRTYYKKMGKTLVNQFHEIFPNLIVSSPDASIYSVIDVKKIAKPNFNSADFVMFCAEEGKIELNGKYMTLLVAPMEGFYQNEEGGINPGRTQMRIAYVETPKRMKLIPELFKKLFYLYESNQK